MASASFDLVAPREPAIRRALKRWLAARVPEGAVLVEELGVAHGAHRVDLCAIGPDLHGFEIKSDQDTLKRLPAQAAHFSRAFHRMTLVVGPALLASSLAHLPPWWGVVLVTTDAAGRAELSELRPARENPALDPLLMAHLLWRDELSAGLRAAGARGLSKLGYAAIAAEAARRLPLSALSALAVQALAMRKGGRASGGPVTRLPAPAGAAGSPPSSSLDAALSPPRSALDAALPPPIALDSGWAAEPPGAPPAMAYAWA